MAFLFLVVFLISIFFRPLKQLIYLQRCGKDQIEKKLVDNPDNPLLNCLVGKENYKRKNFGKAKACFKKAAKSTDPRDKQLKALAHANAGNSGLRLAEILIDKKAKKQEAKARAIELLGDAVADYQRSLDVIPLDEKVLANKNVAENLLKSLQHKPDNDQSQNQSGGGNQGDEQQPNGKGDNQQDGKGGTEGDPTANEQCNDPSSESGENTRSDGTTNKTGESEAEQKAKESQKARNDNASSKDTSQPSDKGDDDNGSKAKDAEQKEMSGSKNAADAVKTEPAADAPKNNGPGAGKNKPLTNASEENEQGSKPDKMFELEEDENENTPAEETAENKDKTGNGSRLRVAQQNMEAELKRLDDQEATLRRQRIVGITAEGATAKQKGW